MRRRMNSRRSYIELRRWEVIGAWIDVFPEAGPFSIATGAEALAVPSNRISATSAPGVEYAR